MTISEMLNDYLSRRLQCAELRAGWLDECIMSQYMPEYMQIELADNAQNTPQVPLSYFMGIRLKLGYYVLYADYHDEVVRVYYCETLQEAEEYERSFNEVAFGGYLVYVFYAQE